MVGVQWHPEETAEHDPAQQSLFDALSLLARVRGARGEARRDGKDGSRAFGIVPYDPGWPARFETESARIEEALGDQVVRVEHVGSTAVPGLGGQARRGHPGLGPNDGAEGGVRATARSISAIDGRWTRGPTSTSSSAGTKDGQRVVPHPCVRAGQRVGTAPSRLPRLASEPPRRCGRVRALEARSRRTASARHRTPTRTRKPSSSERSRLGAAVTG